MNIYDLKMPTFNGPAMPCPSIAKEYSLNSGAGFVYPIIGYSEFKYRRAVYTLARYFRREFEYDGIQYNDPRWPEHSGVVAYLWLEYRSGQTVAVGACCFRWREYLGGCWAMQWIWMHPYERRKKHLSKAWPEFRRVFGKFHVEGPLSPAMRSFVQKHGQQDIEYHI